MSNEELMATYYRLRKQLDDAVARGTGWSQVEDLKNQLALIVAELTHREVRY
jgi:hypothetical protein